MSNAAVYLVWGLLGGAALGLWAWSRADRTTIARPSMVLVRAATGPLLRISLVVGWMWVGWHLFAR